MVSGRIFSTWNDRSSVTSAWRRAIQKTSIHDLKFHDLRHSFVTRLQNFGVDYEVRQWLADHKMKGSTQGYSHGGPGWDAKLRDAVEKLNVSYGLSYGDSIPEGRGEGEVTKGLNLLVPRDRIELSTPAFSGLCSAN